MHHLEFCQEWFNIFHGTFLVPRMSQLSTQLWDRVCFGLPKRLPPVTPDSEWSVLLLLLDLSTVFDMVSYSLLTHRLTNAGVEE